MNKDKKIGFWSSTSLVVGNMIGSGVFLLPASLALYGSISLFGWLFSSIGALLLAVLFGYLGRLLPETKGGPYAYVRESMGDFLGYLVAWGYWISIWCTNAGIAVAFVGYLEVLFPELGDNSILAAATALAVIWIFTWINSKTLKTVAIVQLITTILKIVPIVGLGIIGIFFIDFDYFQAFNMSDESTFSAITSTMTLTLFAYLGIESVAIAGNDVENAEKEIKRSTLIGTIITIVIYVLCSITIMGLVPPSDLKESSAPFADAGEVIFGASAKYIVAIGALIATLGALNGWILIQGQIPMVAAQNKLFPKIFQKRNRSESPVFGIVISSVLASILIGLNYSKGFVEAFTFMMKLSTLSVITPYLLSSLALYFLLKRHNKINMSFLILIALTLFFCVWVIVGCGIETTIWGVSLLLLGIPLYYTINRN